VRSPPPAALSGFAVGALWYGPLLGKQWMAAAGVKLEDIQMTNFPRMYGITLLMSLVAAYVLAHVVNRFEATTIAAGAQAGFWLWRVHRHGAEAMFNAPTCAWWRSFATGRLGRRWRHPAVRA
jgi:hypothetical protein